jgi:KaiC/GvpD/RAD55 family RecA-like ATPase
MINPEVIKASESFRCAIIAMLAQSDWLARHGDIIIPEHFPTTYERDIVRWVTNFYTKYKRNPTYIELENGIGEEAAITLYAFADVELQHAADEALSFAKTEHMRMAILKSVEAIQQGDLESPYDYVKQALAVGSDTLELGQELLADANSWMYDELHGRKFPTGWNAVDSALDGGIMAGEYGLIMAPPGSGKTTALLNIGYALAGLYGGANVLHVSAEMSQSKVLKRYATRITGVQIRRNSADEDGLVERIQRTAARRLKGRLRVIYLKDKRVNAISTLIDNLAVEGFSTDALIIDYADLLHTKNKRNEYRFQLAEISRDLRDLGNQYGIPVWSATQAGRQALSKDIITMADISEAIEKAAIADVIISVCQTHDERELNKGRLFLAKVRDGEGGTSVPINIDFSRQLIIQSRNDL